MTVIPRTMKAVQLVGHGGLDQLVYRDDVPTPELIVTQPGGDVSRIVTARSHIVVDLDDPLVDATDLAHLLMP
ncbi:MAG: hypothetical protein ACX931_03040 [Saccharospirillum sp.]